jgi:hypothetical protein
VGRHEARDERNGKRQYEDERSVKGSEGVIQYRSLDKRRVATEANATPLRVQEKTRARPWRTTNIRMMVSRDGLRRHSNAIVLVASTPGWPASGDSWTWQRQLTAPLETLQSVRTSSQQARAQFELQLTTDALVAKGFNVKPVRFRYPSDSLTPLSWHLTPHQQKNIGAAWSNPSIDLITQREILLRGLGCAIPSEAQ